MRIEVGGLLGLIVLIADVWAIVHVFGSRRSVGAKVGWTVLILIFGEITPKSLRLRKRYLDVNERKRHSMAKE